MTDDDFDPALVLPEPCPEDPAHTTEDAYGGPCRVCQERLDGLSFGDDPRPIGRAGPGEHPAW